MLKQEPSTRPEEQVREKKKLRKKLERLQEQLEDAHIEQKKAEERLLNAEERLRKRQARVQRLREQLADLEVELTGRSARSAQAEAVPIGEAASSRESREGVPSPFEKAREARQAAEAAEREARQAVERAWEAEDRVEEADFPRHLSQELKQLQTEAAQASKRAREAERVAITATQMLPEEQQEQLLSEIPLSEKTGEDRKSDEITYEQEIEALADEEERAEKASQRGSSEREIEGVVLGEEQPSGMGEEKLVEDSLLVNVEKIEVLTQISSSVTEEDIEEEEEPEGEDRHFQAAELREEEATVETFSAIMTSDVAASAADEAEAVSEIKSMQVEGAREQVRLADEALEQVQAIIRDGKLWGAAAQASLRKAEREVRQAHLALSEAETEAREAVKAANDAEGEAQVTEQMAFSAEQRLEDEDQQTG